MRGRICVLLLLLAAPAAATECEDACWADYNAAMQQCQEDHDSWLAWCLENNPDEAYDCYEHASDNAESCRDYAEYLRFECLAACDDSPVEPRSWSLVKSLYR